MADAPWRCSQCGTVNEPGANACRTCGRWPSLFDLDEGKVDELEAESEDELEPSIQDFEGELLGDTTVEPADLAEPAEQEPPAARPRRLVRRVIIPLGIVIYLVISFVTNR